MSNKPFIHLHQHSMYSALDGCGTVEQIVKKAKRMGSSSVAITDHGNMNSFCHLYQEAKKADIKPIFGCEFYYVPNLKKWNIMKEQHENEKNDSKKKDLMKLLRQRFHVLVLVKNKIGFKNINKLIFESYRNFYYRPRIDYNLLKKYKEGLIISTACIGGEVQQLIINREFNKVEKRVRRLKEIFKNNLYFELQFNEIKDQINVNEYMVMLSKKYNIKTILTNDNHYIEKNDNQTHQSLLLLQTKSTYKDLKNPEKNIWTFDTKELYYKSYHDMKYSFERWGGKLKLNDFENSYKNTIRLADNIESFELDSKVKLKEVYIENKDKISIIKNKCFKELKNKGLHKKKEYVDRLKFELNVIKEKKIENYFLIVADIVEEAKKEMLIGCGRGSAAGSLAVYLLGITDIDPLVHKLYFERFLAVDRHDYPDIDIDFEDNDKIKKDLMVKYPNEVACITSYSTFQISGLLKDLIRIHNVNISSYEMNHVTKEIRRELENIEEEDSDEKTGKDVLAGTGYNVAYKYSKAFKQIMDEYKDIARDMKILLGQVRHVGKHAAGVIICDDLIKLQPTMIIKGVLQTSLTEGTKEKTLADLGYVKMDILGLKTLKIIHNTIKSIMKQKGISEKRALKEIAPNKMNLNDLKVYKNIFHKDKLKGIFQFETDSARSLIKDLKPDSFQDLCVLNGLNRPGPLKGGFAYEYGDLKKGKKTPNYYGNKIVEKVLKSTFGIITFQEQMMQLWHELGGISLAETNYLRKLIVKANKIEGSIKKQLEEYKNKYMKGCLKNKIKKIDAEKMWQQMIQFSGYGFNLAHSVSYAMIAYQCAYLKTYYPIAFYTALLNSDEANEYNQIINEVNKEKNIEIELLDLNKSKNDFSHDENTIYWGFTNINGIGTKASQEIIRIRKLKPIEKLTNFLKRDDISWRLINKTVMETLIKIGAFDQKKKKKNSGNTMLRTYEIFLNKKNHINISQKEWNKLSRFKKVESSKIKALEEVKNGEIKSNILDSELIKIELNAYKLNIKYDIFGLNEYKEKIKILNKRKIAGSFKDKREYTIIKILDYVVRNDKRKQEMCFLNVIDTIGQMQSCLIFSSNFKGKNSINDDDIFLTKGNHNKGTFIINTYKNLKKLNVKKS